MKKGINLMILAIMAIGYVSCEKPKEKDYRDKWVGSYECEEIYTWCSGPIDTVHTKIYKTNVIVTAKNDAWIVFCVNRNEKRYGANVNEDGSFNEINDIEPRYINGIFHADSLNMTIVHSYSPGHSNISYFKGKKQK